MKNGKATLLPLTLGLLASAMQRRNHATFLPPHLRFMPDRPWRPEMVHAMDEIMVKWDQARCGSLHDVQIMEEFDGTGFYRPEREDHYAGMFAGFDGMAEIALSRLQAFRGVMEGST